MTVLETGQKVGSGGGCSVKSNGGSLRQVQAYPGRPITHPKGPLLNPVLDPSQDNQIRVTVGVRVRVREAASDRLASNIHQGGSLECGVIDKNLGNQSQCVLIGSLG